MSDPLWFGLWRLYAPSSPPNERQPEKRRGEAMEVLQTEALTRRFGDLKAVDGLTIAVGEGETFGLLGPNGAGKTTAI
jgi:ABC-2 type transport system ATP-binding protein